MSSERPQKRSLQEVRDDIDALDHQLLLLLEERLQLAEEIADIKGPLTQAALTDPPREQEIIGRLQRLATHDVLRAEIPRLFSQLMDMSKQIRVRRLHPDNSP